jgi:hypothetical protein
MKALFLALAASALALGSGAALAGAEPGTATAAKDAATVKGEARLDKMLAGRAAGNPVSCIPALADNRLEVIDRTAIVYDAGSTIYVAKPQEPAMLRGNDILVVRRFGSQLCRQDVVRTVDRMTGFNTGVVFLSDFVPYRKAAG